MSGTSGLRRLLLGWFGLGLKMPGRSAVALPTSWTSFLGWPWLPEVGPFICGVSYSVILTVSPKRPALVPSLGTSAASTTPSSTTLLTTTVPLSARILAWPVSMSVVL